MGSGNDYVLITGNNRPVEYEGACPLVVIHGYDLVVDLTGAQIQGVRIAGSRNAVTAGALDDAAVQGFDNVLEADEIASVSVLDDRNAVTATGEIGTVVAAGFDTVITAGTLGSGLLEIEGSRNTVTGEAGGPDVVTVNGHSNAIESDTIAVAGGLTVTGTDNTVTAQTEIGEITIDGYDNIFTAPTLGEHLTGDRNEFHEETP